MSGYISCITFFLLSLLFDKATESRRTGFDDEFGFWHGETCSLTAESSDCVMVSRLVDGR
ncbi:MAG: hypothetical protein OK454_08525 [Thaumarchaeota archaeon]|nr:hypothetical protein [Nitrososphaerota archaeon]